MLSQNSLNYEGILAPFFLSIKLSDDVTYLLLGTFYTCSVTRCCELKFAQFLQQQQK